MAVTLAGILRYTLYCCLKSAVLAGTVIDADACIIVTRVAVAMALCMLGRVWHGGLRALPMAARLALWVLQPEAEAAVLTSVRRRDLTELTDLHVSLSQDHC